jgi:hypothetical protein
MLFVLAAVAVGLLLMLLVGLLIRPEDGKQPTGGRPLQAPGTAVVTGLR